MEYTIIVTELSTLPSGKYQVRVDGRIKTMHEVLLDEQDYLRLKKPVETPEQLLERSFQFLLEREPNTSILSEFNLMLINTYFPEYEQVMKNG